MHEKMYVHYSTLQMPACAFIVVCCSDLSYTVNCVLGLFKMNGTATHHSSSNNVPCANVHNYQWTLNQVFITLSVLVTTGTTEVSINQ